MTVIYRPLPCLQSHINNLRKLVKRMNENEGAYVAEALRFERDFEQSIEGCVSESETACETTGRSLLPLLEAMVAVRYDLTCSR